MKNKVSKLVHFFLGRVIPNPLVFAQFRPIAQAPGLTSRMASTSSWPNTSREERRQASADHTVWFRGIKLTIENGDQTIVVVCCGDMLLDIFEPAILYLGV